MNFKQLGIVKIWGHIKKELHDTIIYFPHKKIIVKSVGSVTRIWHFAKVSVSKP